MDLRGRATLPWSHSRLNSAYPDIFTGVNTPGSPEEMLLQWARRGAASVSDSALPEGLVLTVTPFVRGQGETILGNVYGASVAASDNHCPRPWGVWADLYGFRASGFWRQFGFNVGGKVRISGPVAGVGPSISVAGQFTDVNRGFTRSDVVFVADQRLLSRGVVTANLGYSHGRGDRRASALVPAVGALWAFGHGFAVSGDYIFRNAVDSGSFWSAGVRYRVGDAALLAVGIGKHRTFFAAVTYGGPAR
jgi:hypothetical protein